SLRDRGGEVAFRLYGLLSGRDRGWASDELLDRRAIVLRHFDGVIEALVAGQTLPPAPDTGSPEVDRNLAATVSALEQQYPPALERLRGVTADPVGSTRE